MNDLISIIVPIYKVEQYLERCLDSILQQTYSNYELILVDDGSPDKCGEICEEYARRDNRVRVIHKSNGGLSDARNVGISISKGEFIAFIDSDDWVAPEYLACMIGALKKTKSDICECGVIRTDGILDESVISNEDESLLQTYNVENALEELICDGIFHQYVWNKLYRRKCICRIDFPVGKTHEDEFWTYQVFGKAKTIVKIERKLYYYFQRSGSIMGEKYNLRRLDVLEAKEQRQKYMQENYPTLAESAGINLFISCIYNGQMSLKFLKDEQRKSAVRIIQQIQIQNRPDKKTVSKMTGSTRLWIRLAKRHFWATCIVKNLLRKGF